MASGSLSRCSQLSPELSGASGWDTRQNKLFETALAVYDERTPDRWQKVARYVGSNKSPEEVKRYYDRLLDDVNRIDSGLVPFPNYTSSAAVAAPRRR